MRLIYDKNDLFEFFFLFFSTCKRTFIIVTKLHENMQKQYDEVLN